MRALLHNGRRVASRGGEQANAERGQAAVLSVLVLTVLLGMSALVIDAGYWHTTDRALQAKVDAAALAGAQELPWDQARARVVAIQYAQKNGGGVAAGDISFPSADLIRIEGSEPAQTFFAKVFGLESVTVNARASARASHLARPQGVAPVAVDEQHPMLQCSPAPCHDQTDLPLFHLHRPGSGTAAGSFGLINLDGRSGEVQASTLGAWLLNGWDGYLDIGWYRVVPSAKFNSIEIRSALDQRIGDVLMFPVWRTISGDGENAEFLVVAWVGFKLTGYTISGSNGKLHGHFTHTVWHGIPSDSGPPGPDLGVRTISLVE